MQTGKHLSCFADPWALGWFKGTFVTYFTLIKVF